MVLVELVAESLMDPVGAEVASEVVGVGSVVVVVVL